MTSDPISLSSPSCQRCTLTCSCCTRLDEYIASVIMNQTLHASSLTCEKLASSYSIFYEFTKQYILNKLQTAYYKSQQLLMYYSIIDSPTTCSQTWAKMSLYSWEFYTSVMHYNTHWKILWGKYLQRIYCNFLNFNFSYFFNDVF